MQELKHIIIAADHAGFKMKRLITDLLKDTLGYTVDDVGAKKFDEDDDYPDFATALAARVTKTGFPGIAICGSGVGICTVLNKHKGINAGVAYNINVAEQMKNDDHTNVLCIGARTTTEDHARAIVRRWLETPFSVGERHVRRVNKMKEIEKDNMK